MAYKVFRVHEGSNTHTSSHAKGWLQRVYTPEIGREEKGEGMFLFHGLVYAVHFATIQDLWCIWEVETTSDVLYPPCDWILDSATDPDAVEGLRVSWQSWYAAVQDETSEDAEYFTECTFGKRYAPAGTVICDSFRYVKQYNPLEEN